MKRRSTRELQMSWTRLSANWPVTKSSIPHGPFSYSHIPAGK